MNMQVVFDGDNARVLDEKGNEKTVPNCDNLNDVLSKENLIETIEKEIKQLEQEMSSNEGISKILRKMVNWSSFVFFTLLPLLIFPCVFELSGFNENVNLPLFGSIKEGFFIGMVSSFIYSIPGLFLSLSLHISDKKREHEQRGKEVQLEFLKNELEKQKEYLSQLRMIKTNNNKKESSHAIKIDNKEMLKKLKNILLFYYDLGFNEEKYFKYYRQGLLENYLDAESVHLASEHFEEKGPTLIKKKKR